MVKDAQLTQVGEAFQNRIFTQTTYVNLFPDNVDFLTGVSSGATADVSIQAFVRNNGNSAPDGPFQVAYYKDVNLTQLIGAATVLGPTADRPGMIGCATRVIGTSIVWQDLTPGLHKYWVKVDRMGSVPESDETDNVVMGIVIVDPEELFLPVFR